MLLLVGLGNPGAARAGHRHNIGFMALDELAREHGFGPFRARFGGLWSEGRLDDHAVRLLKPLTFMNESGRSVGEAARYYRLDAARVYVFHDEIDLVPGKCRVRNGGGSGGHNGIRSIDRHIGNGFWRVRLGVGHPGHRDRVYGYVLHDFSAAERDSWLPVLLGAVARDAPLLARGEENAFMSRVAQTVFPPPQKPAPRPVPGEA